MSRSPSLSDDEALWFPVHSIGGDSFSRPATPDGAPLSEDNDDGIGLPSRVRSGGPRRPKPPGKGGKAAYWLWLPLWGAAALGIVAFAARKEIAAELIQGWLKGQGVEQAHLTITSLSFDRASGQIHVGTQSAPVFSIGRFDIDYSLQPFAGGGQPLARVRKVHLKQPLVQFSFKDGQLNFGTLDKLVRSALTAPPSSAPPPESIVIDAATVRVVTDYGLVRGHGHLSLKDGQLTFAEVTVPSAELSGPLGSGELTRGVITARSVAAAGVGDQLQVKARFEAEHWAVRNAADPVEQADTASRPMNLQGVTVDIDALLPYRKAVTIAQAYSGATEQTVAVRARGVQTADADIGGLEANLHLKGDLKTHANGTEFTGKGRLLSRAETLMSGEIDSRNLRLEGRDLDVTAAIALDKPVTVAVDGPVSVEAALLRQNDLFVRDAKLELSNLSATLDSAGFAADLAGTLDMGRVAVADIALDRVRVALTGQAGSETSTGQWQADLRGDVSTDQGSYAGLKPQAEARLKAAAALAQKPPLPGAPNPPPPDAMVTLDRALSRFSLRAKGLSLGLSGASEPGTAVRMRLSAATPITLALDGGGTAVITPVATQPLLDSDRTGAFSIDVKGEDLPTAAITVAWAGFRDTGLLAADYRAVIDFDSFPIAGGHFEGQGGFAATDAAGFEITLSQPATFTATSAVLGDAFTNLDAKIVQGDAPFVALDGLGGFRVRGALQGLSLDAPNLQARFTDAAAAFEAFSIPGADVVGLKATLMAGRLTDALPPEQTRFHPVTVKGTLTNDARALSGRFEAQASRGQRPVAKVNLDNDNLTGQGALSFTTADYLTFSPQGLQPVYLTPMVAAIMSRDVTGKARFDGAVRWDPDTTSSDGVLSLDGLNFTGATGMSRNLNGRIVFTSLTPMRSDPGQVISIGSMDVGVPLRDLKLSVQFQGEAVAIESAVVQSPGGPLMLEPTVLPLDGTSAISGAVSFNGLDFGKVIAASELASSMTFDGHLSGRLPFKIEAGRLSFSDGVMESDAPGRISVRRTAVTGVAATGSLTPQDPNTAVVAAPVSDPNFNPFHDLAFQAMEWVRYDDIDARLNSIPGGLLNINFHIKGYFDPPQKQSAKIGMVDYITGKWMQKPILLPSGTPVELYLEVPVNLDEILEDLTAFSVRTAAKPADAQ